MENQKDLLFKARVGDLVAYGQIVKNYQDMAVGYAFSILGDFHLAEDATQEAFIEAYRYLPRLREPKAFAAWFRRIVFKHCDRLTRKRQEESLSPETVAEMPSGKLDTLEEMEKEEVREWVHKTIRALPEPERTVTTLFYLSDLSHREIAVFLEISQTQVNNLLRRSRKRLKEGMLKMAQTVLKSEASSRGQQLAGRVLSALRSFAGTYGQVALSPDEKLVAFSVRSSDWKPKMPGSPNSKFLSNGVPSHRGGAEIWVTDLEGAHVRILTPEWGTSWEPSWSPDGRRLAFYSDKNDIPQVWIWDRETGDMQLASDEPVCVLRGKVIWLPDGKKLIIKLRSDGWTPPSREPERTGESREVWDSLTEHTPQPSPGEAGWRWYDDFRGDIAILDTENGELRRLGNDLFVVGMALSPDGRYVGVQCLGGMGGASGFGDGNVMQNDLHIFAVDGSKNKMLTKGFSQAFRHVGFSWSPKSDAIAYTTFGNGLGKLVLACLDGRQKVMQSEHINLGNEEGTPPLWSPDGKTIYCWANMAIYAVCLETEEIQNLTKDLGRRVYGIMHSPSSGTVNAFGRPESMVVFTRHPKTKCEGLFRIDQGKPVPIVEELNRYLLQMFLSGDCTDKWIVGPIQDATRPSDLYCIDVHTGQERRLTSLNPDLEMPSYGPIKLLSFKGPGGRSHFASLFLPVGYKRGKQYPIVINLYYGAFQSGSTMNRFVDLNAKLTAAGYAVLWPDMPVSGANPAETITALAVSALDTAIGEGYAHPQRAGVIGHSEGGYDVCCAITKTNRFQAAVAVAPFTNLVSSALSIKAGELIGTPWIEGGILKLRTTVWEDQKRYIDNSPVFHLDKVITPLLLLHGTADFTVSQSEEMYAGLLRLRKKAVLVKYLDEGHVPREWSAENYQDYWHRIIDWYDQHLGSKD